MSKPERTFTFEGNLYKTGPDGHDAKLIRKEYSYAYSRIDTGRKLRSTLRHGQWTFPGCYPLYFITSDGGCLSFESVKENLAAVLDAIRTGTDDGWRVVATEINHDGPLYCDHSNKLIPSAYGPGSY